MLSSIAIASAVFASTDVDDLLLLLALFADPALHWRTVVLGQFFGIALLVLASALIALSAVRITEQYIALLGFVPLGFGLWRFWKSSRSREDDLADAGHVRPIQRRTFTPVIMVTTLTIANGGDNLMAYVPLFAAGPTRIPIYSAVFAVLTAGWCVLAYCCVNNRMVYLHAHRVGRLALPVVMVLLGLWTLSGLMYRPG